MKTRRPIHDVYQPNTPRVQVRALLVHHVYQQRLTDTPRVLVRGRFRGSLIHHVYTLKVLPGIPAVWDRSGTTRPPALHARAPGLDQFPSALKAHAHDRPYWQYGHPSARVLIGLSGTGGGSPEKAENSATPRLRSPAVARGQAEGPATEPEQGSLRMGLTATGAQGRSAVVATDSQAISFLSSDSAAGIACAVGVSARRPRAPMRNGAAFMTDIAGSSGARNTLRPIAPVLPAPARRDPCARSEVGPYAPVAATAGAQGRGIRQFSASCRLQQQTPASPHCVTLSGVRHLMKSGGEVHDCR